MKLSILNLADKIIIYTFYLLFTLVPFFFLPFNYELFEYNKMMLTYGLTIMIVSVWVIKMIASRKIIYTRSPLEFPLLIFLVSQIASTIFSIDRHLSIWGYYSRFNGGLLSIISYLLLYFAFVSNFPKEKIGQLLKLSLISGCLIALYGIWEHFGVSISCIVLTHQVNVNCWVQDVQNRVFATLGQPNWLAAYLTILIPISIGSVLSSITDSELFISLRGPRCYIGGRGNLSESSIEIASPSARNDKKQVWRFGYLFICLLFYLTLLFTKSRSGFIGFGISLFCFLILTLWQTKKRYINHLLLFTASLFLITFFVGTPIDQINHFTYSELLSKKLQSTNYQLPTAKSYGSSLIEVGITESGTIRKIVWKGALDIFKHFPLIGTGVETFADSYYKFRPLEHNMTSEWDFLYNKAHNEYLNYAATTGIFGLGSYLLFIGGFILWFIYNFKFQISNFKLKNSKMIKSLDFDIDLNLWILTLGLFAGWLSILVTNFFGFSVVVVQLFFYLIPAIIFVILKEDKDQIQTNYLPLTNNYQLVTFNYFQYLAIFFVLLVICYLLFTLGRLWYADMLFAEGYRDARSAQYLSAYKSLSSAINLNPDEPAYYDEFSVTAATLSLAYSQDKEATLSTQLKDVAIASSEKTVSISPNNVNFWKNRTRVFYTLASEDEKYFSEAKMTLLVAKDLSPTDVKIAYNLGLLYDKLGSAEEARKELKRGTTLKADYRDIFFALGLLYERQKQYALARQQYEYILKRINPDDSDVKKKLEEIRQF